MSLFTTLDIASNGMHVQRVRMNVASMNMANKDTTATPEGGAYRRRDVYLKTTQMETSFAQSFEKANRQQEEPYLNVTVDRIAPSQEELEKVYDPSHPDADDEGYVEMPNVDALTEMMNILSASRAYEAGTNIMRTVKQMAESAMRIGQ